MELSSKQRAYLRSLSNDLDVIVHIGKDGIGDNLVKQANDALEARELIKCRVLENSMLTAREACDELSALTRSEQVQVIGTKFVLYRPSHKKDKKDKIVLPKAAKNGRGRERGKIFRARRAPAHPGGYPAAQDALCRRGGGGGPPCDDAPDGRADRARHGRKGHSLRHGDRARR